MIWFTVASVLYGLGAIWMLLTLVHEDGKDGPIIMISIVWPAFVMIAIYQYFVGEDDDDDLKSV